jgi:pilus assembly protein CpaE
MERPTVLLALFGDPADYADALRTAGFEPLTDPADLERSLVGNGPDLAVIDADAAPELVQEVHAQLHDGRNVPTLLLFSNEPPRIATTAEARDEYARKPLPTDALLFRLQALLIRSGRHLPVESGAWAASETLTQAPVAGEGQVISVFAPKGGVGKTTVSVNLAVALREQTRANVLLFDADVGVGNVTAVLDVKDNVGLADLADDEPSDAAFEQAVSVHEPSGVRVLTWGSSPAQSELVSVDLLLAALRWARMHHPYVVVDNHPGYDDRTMAMLATANEIFLVVTPEMGAVKNSAQFLDLARQIGLGDTIKVIVNRANHGIRPEDLSKNLGLPIAATVISDGRKAVIAANEGIPLITKFPREKISHDLHGVARLLTQPNGAPTTDQVRRRWFEFGRKATAAAGR